MSSAEAQIVYNRGSFSEPAEAQEGFAKQFDLSQPDKAMNMYQKYVQLDSSSQMVSPANSEFRIMHQHTKQQFETAHASSRRSSTREYSDSHSPSLSSESSNASVSSVSS